MASATTTRRRMCRRCPRSCTGSPPPRNPTCRRSSPHGSTSSTRPARWALLKLITGELRIGVSARLAKTAVASLGDIPAGRGRACLAWARAALPRAVRLGRGPGAAAGIGRPGAVPAADALAPARGGGLRQARCRRLHGRVEMGRHPPPGGLRPAPGRAARPPHLFAHRRGRVRRLPGPRRGARLRGRARRRAPDPAPGPRAELQRAAAAPQPEERHSKAPRRLSGASARLRSSRRGRGGCARAAVRRAPPPPRGAGRAPRQSAHRPVAARARSRPGTSSPRRAPTRPRSAPARMPRRSRAAW